MLNALKISKEEFAVGFALLLGLFLPHTSTAFLIVNPLLCVCLYSHFRKGLENSRHISSKAALLITLFCSFAINAVVLDMPLKLILSFIYFCLLIFCFPIVNGERIGNIFLYTAAIIMLLSQLVYVFRIYPLIAIIDNLYPMSELYENIYSYMDSSINPSNIANFRLGGLFRNPNHMAKYANLIIALFVLENRNVKFEKKICFFFLGLLIVLFTGSRTGLFIAILLFAFAIRVDENLSKTKKIFVYACFVIGFILFAISGSGFRGLELQEGMSDSAGSKFNALAYYLSQDNSLLSLLFGNLAPDTFQSTSGIIDQFDAEYGYVIFQYGFVGLFAYSIFWIKMFTNYPPKNRLIFLLLLWMISSTVMFAYRSAFVMLLAFSVFYSYDTKAKTFDSSN